MNSPHNSLYWALVGWSYLFTHTNNRNRLFRYANDDHASTALDVIGYKPLLSWLWLDHFGALYLTLSQFLVVYSDCPSQFCDYFSFFSSTKPYSIVQV